jgi:hypothetical protein
LLGKCGFPGQFPVTACLRQGGEELYVIRGWDIGISWRDDSRSMCEKQRTQRADKFFLAIVLFAAMLQIFIESLQ